MVGGYRKIALPCKPVDLQFIKFACHVLEPLAKISTANQARNMQTVLCTIPFTVRLEDTMIKKISTCTVTEEHCKEGTK